MRIGIIDYGMGNLHSVVNALDFIGVSSFISNEPTRLLQADKLILPGVGAFCDAIKQLNDLELSSFIEESVHRKTPLLGICLGMQLLFETSYEYGQHEGLGLLKGDIVPFNVSLKIPHMGWNQLKINKKQPLFINLPEPAHVYFVHSYHLETSEDIVSATTQYEKEIQIAVQKDNIYGLQFHPEKSGEVGLEIIRNFTKL